MDQHQPQQPQRQQVSVTHQAQQVPQLPPPGQGPAQTQQPPARRLLARQDQEELVVQRIRSAIRMGIMMRDAQKQASDNVLLECALDGVVNGAAVEIIRSLNMEPCYQSITRPRSLNQQV